MDGVVRTRIIGVVFAAAVLAAAAPVQAQVYRCTVGGKTIYQEQPCAGGAPQKEIAPRRAEPAAQAAKTTAKLPPPNPKLLPWNDAERDVFLAGCTTRGTKQRMNDYSRKHGARLPPEVAEKVADSQRKPCNCLFQKASVRWSLVQYQEGRERFEPLLRSASPECFK
jgi:hypothetical protein